MRVDVPQVRRGQAGLQLRLRLPVPVHLAALLHFALPALTYALRVRLKSTSACPVLCNPTPCSRRPGCGSVWRRR